LICFFQHERILSLSTRRESVQFPRKRGTPCLTQRTLARGLGILIGIAAVANGASAREREVAATQLIINTGRAGCTVEVDADPPGKTDAQGKLVLHDVDPTDHYIHLRCPEEPRETVYFVAPRPGQKLEIRHSSSANESSASPPDPAEAKIKLRELVQQAVQLRTQARFDEAVQQLRQAARMDPENSDLHRELGITFLLSKDWKRARTEMLEAIRHEPTDADAHNGLGYALEKLGEIKPALNEYRTATHLDPEDPSYRQHYLEALVKEAGERQERGKKR